MNKKNRRNFKINFYTILVIILILFSSGCVGNSNTTQTTQKQESISSPPSLEFDAQISSVTGATILYAIPDLPFVAFAISNSGGSKAKDVTVTISIENLAEDKIVNIGDLNPGETKEEEVNLIFKKNILKLTTPLNTQITFLVNYKDMEGESYTQTFSKDIQIDSRYRMYWEHPKLISAWITKSDQTIRKITTSVCAGLAPGQYTEDSVECAERLWRYLQKAGVRYVSDPQGIEYVQYPLETLSKRAGDCEDLSVLYATMLESVGIKTKLILLSDHIFMGFIDNEGYIHPIETTILKSYNTYEDAREIGNQEYKENENDIIDIIEPSQYYDIIKEIDVSDIIPTTNIPEPVPEFSISFQCITQYGFFEESSLVKGKVCNVGYAPAKNVELRISANDASAPVSGYIELIGIDECINFEEELDTKYGVPSIATVTVESGEGVTTSSQVECITG